MQVNAPASAAERGTLFLVVGPSGSGKDTLLKGARAALRADTGFVFPQRVITRPVDTGGEDHLTATLDKFEAAKTAGAFALHWTAHGYAYGVPNSIKRDLDAGRSVVVNVSRTVIDHARARLAPVRVIFLTVSDDVLAPRLAARGRESASEIEARLRRARAFRVHGDDVIEIANDGNAEDAIKRFVGVMSDTAGHRSLPGMGAPADTADTSV